MEEKTTENQEKRTHEEQTQWNEARESNQGSQPPYPPYQPPYPPYYPAYPPPYRQEESSKPKIVGALLITTAILGLIFGTVLVGFGGVIMADMETNDFGFPGNADIYGRVIDSNGTGLANVSVSINGTHLRTTTNDQGTYILLGVPSGANEIVVEKDGYTTLVYKTFTVPDNNQFNFTMAEGAGYRVYGGAEFPFIRTAVMAVGIASIFFSIAALVGGIFALKKQHFGVVVSCTVAAIFSIGFCLGSILAIIALLVLIMSSKEFKKKSTQNAQG